MKRVPYVMPGTVKDVFIYFLFYLGLALTHAEPESKRLGQEPKVGQPLGAKAGLASTSGLTPEFLSLQPSWKEHATPLLPLVWADLDIFPSILVDSIVLTTLLFFQMHVVQGCPSLCGRGRGGG